MQPSDWLEGAPSFSFETHKLPDGRFKVTSPSMVLEGKEWFGDNEAEATMNATRDVYDMATRGELNGR